MITYTDLNGPAESDHSPMLEVSIVSGEDFVTTWKTDNSGTSSSTEITLPIVGGPYKVDWDNDGIFDQAGLVGAISHNYGVAGVYTVRVHGTLDTIQFNNSGDKEKILSIVQWGSNQWATMERAFFGAVNLTIPAVDIPVFSFVTNMSFMFYNATSANPDTSGWDTSAVTNMERMFYNATSASPDTSSWNTTLVTSMKGMFWGAIVANPNTIAWNTASVTDMGYMFYKAPIANPHTSGWVTSSVTDMRNMFADASSANPDTSSWNTASVTRMDSMFYSATVANPDTSGWNTSVVTNMSYMFYQATVANPDTSGWNTSVVTNMSAMFNNATVANPDTSNWDTVAVMDLSWAFASAPSINPDTSSWITAGVVNMQGMFYNATSANPDTSNWNTAAVTNMDRMFYYAVSFDQDIGSWNVSSLTTATDMFSGVVLSLVNYESLLVGWNSQELKTGVNFSGGNSFYCAVAATSARLNMILSDAWVITDGGQQCPPSAPLLAPDLTPTSDTGGSVSDDLTMNYRPEFYLNCSAPNNIITLYTDNPLVTTPVGTYQCTTVGIEVMLTGSGLVDGIHNISYTDKVGLAESSHSPALSVTIDTVPPAGPGALSAPVSPTTDIHASIVGSCGLDAANGKVMVTTTVANGFINSYNIEITLDNTGAFTIVDPNWGIGSYTLNYSCTDAAGNGPETMGPFGPVVIEMACNAIDLVVSGGFPAGMFLCRGSNSLTTAGDISIESGAAVYFQSPETTLMGGFTVKLGATFNISPVLGNVPPLISGPDTIFGATGSVLVFADTHVCEDYENGYLAVEPLDTGVLPGELGVVLYTLSCTDFDNITVSKYVSVVVE